MRDYLGHGMARSVGPVGEAASGVVTNPVSGNRYEISTDAQGVWLQATFPDGGVRRQKLVGRIGAGIFDTSWAVAEYDWSESATGRLFFAPVEWVTGRGWELAPFDLHAQSPGLDLALTEGCLTCHTLSDPSELPGAATAAGAGKSKPYPPNALGADAFEHLEPLGCGACHGEVERHAEIMSGRIPAAEGELGLRRIGRLDPGVQRDLCARCHLQGDARIDLVGGRPRPELPLAGQIPVLVPAKALDDFRFVGQLERLALSACFRSTPEMTCTTCHQPHRGAAAQGTASFDAACRRCHDRIAANHAAGKVEEVTGLPPRTADGCVDCHVRRSQPFDLPLVRTADHFIRKRIPPPKTDLAHRPFADAEGALEIYDDGRLAPLWATPEGKRWRAGVLALGLTSLGRVQQAAELLEGIPPPGTYEARRSSSAVPMAPLETAPAFHTIRALVLLASGKLAAAKEAFGDALELDPLAADARIGRARLSLDGGDIATAIGDTQVVINAYPAAEQPWDLRLAIAERVGRPDLAIAALRASTARWPSNPTAWRKLGLLLRQRGDTEAAEQALARARALSPSLSLPAPQPAAAP